MLNIHDKKIVEILQLADFKALLLDIQRMLLHEDDPNYFLCDDKTLLSFLNGLIFLKRGKDPARPLPPDENISNNLVLKKLRVAFELKEQDILDLFKKNGFELGPSELSAFFRKEGHSNYRNCGDQFLRNFLKSLTAKLRP